ncbi:hypothetical protein F4V43_13305 [Paenibacillus spiritus]|uniref:Carbohydrate-binding protein n=1 Tax=Paenibacillus spiritus TaxID=2496557 RepID=A0A5J5G5K1_9BACL|nr:polysaccharide lyase family protein [Paenibacillus spiritus]KAA9002392.1 hypothetical protein F4V43_13305 [Paenibacillus spiritus]
MTSWNRPDGNTRNICNDRQEASTPIPARRSRPRSKLLSRAGSALAALALILGGPALSMGPVYAEQQPASASTAAGITITPSVSPALKPAVTQAVYAPQAGAAALAAAAPQGKLWEIGKHDGSSAEFADFKPMTAVYSTYASDPAAPDWKAFPKGMKASVNKTLSIGYKLDALPAYGAELDVHILNAYMSVPQMAVYSNGRLAGMLQIAGTSGSGGANPYRDGYRLYIPVELLKSGSNELKLEVYAGSYAGTSGDAYLWYEWDELSLTALEAPAAEPIHGRYVHLGTAITNGFAMNDNVTRLLPGLTEWLGSAYSGNMMRVPAWSDTRNQWQDGLGAYLQTLKDLNLQPVVGMIGSNYMGSTEMLAGHVSEEIKTYIRQFMASYGSSFAYLELDNEPGVFNHNQASLVELAQFLQSQKAAYPQLKIVAPGWAYWPSKGTPYGWERDPAQRRPIEALSDLTNGHSYGLSGLTQGRGGSLNENLLSYNGGTEEGLPKEMMMTETGANDLHTDNSKFGATAYKYAAAFDRELRADIGYADHMMQHTAFDTANPNYALFAQPANWSTHRAADTAAWSANAAEGGETRLRTFRRLAAAYATHGSPLAYSFLSSDESAGRKIYVRAVDTRALGASSIGASADKRIVSIVNFEPAGTPARRVAVRIMFPDNAAYRVEQYRDGKTLGAAYSSYERTASPYMDVDLNVAAGEAVQLYLTPKETQAPAQPVIASAAMATWNTAVIQWGESADNRKTTGYVLYRDGAELAVLPAAVTRYTDTSVAYDHTYAYTVRAFDDSGNSSAASSPATLAVPDMPVTPGGPLYEAEKGKLGGIAKTAADAAASSQGYVRDMHGSGASVSIINIMPGAGDYSVRIGYATAADATLNLYVNDKLIRKLTFASTGKSSGAGAYKSIATEVALTDGPNTVMLRHDSGNTGGVNLDYIELTPKQGLPSTETGWRDYAFSDEGIFYSAGIATNENGSWNETESSGEIASFSFTGTGVRWLSNVQSNMGTAQVYIDNVAKGIIDLTSANLEGYSKVVYEVKNLTDAPHSLRIVSLEGKVTFNRFSVNGQEQALRAGQ